MGNLYPDIDPIGQTKLVPFVNSQMGLRQNIMPTSSWQGTVGRIPENELSQDASDLARHVVDEGYSESKAPVAPEIADLKDVTVGDTVVESAGSISITCRVLFKGDAEILTQPIAQQQTYLQADIKSNDTNGSSILFRYRVNANGAKTADFEERLYQVFKLDYESLKGILAGYKEQQRLDRERAYGEVESLIKARQNSNVRGEAIRQRLQDRLRNEP